MTPSGKNLTQERYDMKLDIYKALSREEQLSYLAELRQYLKPEHYKLKVERAKNKVLNVLHYNNKYNIQFSITEAKTHLIFNYNSKEERNQVLIGTM